MYLQSSTVIKRYVRVGTCIGLLFLIKGLLRFGFYITPSINAVLAMTLLVMLAFGVIALCIAYPAFGANLVGVFVSSLVVLFFGFLQGLVDTILRGFSLDTFLFGFAVDATIMLFVTPALLIVAVLTCFIASTWRPVEGPPPKRPEIRCPHCDYSLRGLTTRRCPECGQRI